MCLIIYKDDKTKTIEPHILDNAARINPDGFGITYLDTGETVKTMNKIEARELIEAPRPFVAHYRYATVGKVSKANCHPFNINNRYLLYSNGTVADLGDKQTTDTEVVASYLRFMKTKRMRKALLSMSDVRFAFVDTRSGKVEMHGNWITREGIYYSKGNCFYRPITPVKEPSNNGHWNTGWKNGQHYGHNNVVTQGTEQRSFWSDRGTRPSAQADRTPSPSPQRGKRATVTPTVTPSNVVKPKKAQAPKLPEMDTWEGNCIVAVYGTLRRGESNHRLISKAKYLGEGWTEESYRMEGQGVPVLFDDLPDDLVQGVDYGTVSVELYYVSARYIRDNLDALEGHPHTYRRKQVPVFAYEEGDTVTAWIYFSNWGDIDRRKNHYMQWSFNPSKALVVSKDLIAINPDQNDQDDEETAQDAPQDVPGTTEETSEAIANLEADLEREGFTLQEIEALTDEEWLNYVDCQNKLDRRSVAENWNDELSRQLDREWAESQNAMKGGNGE